MAGMTETHHSNPRYRAPRPTAWLWKTAVAIIVVAGGFIAMMARDLPDPSAQTAIRKVVAVAMVAVGICVIAATAGRWISR